MSHSGVAIQSNYLISGLLKTGKYSFRCFGAAIKHGNYDTVVVNEDFIIKPIDGFGSKELIRAAIASERPDAVLLFTDPRFFGHVFQISDEIKQVCPILYNTIWDDNPIPLYNKPLYDSCDVLNCISRLTYDMIKTLCPEKTNYIPHALPQDLFFPLSEKETKKYKEMLLGKDKMDYFVGLWIGRNAKRKRPGDLLHAWRIFLDMLQEKYGHQKAVLTVSTDPCDMEGPNLYSVCEHFNLFQNIFFQKDHLETPQINILHNISDFGINVSINEGFGLPALETIQTGKPIIAPLTGGQQTLVINENDGTENGVAMKIDLRSLVGSQTVPYIYEDYVSSENIARAIMKMYEFGPEKRKEIGIKAREYALSNFSLDNLISKWDQSLEQTINKSRKHWEFMEI